MESTFVVAGASASASASVTVTPELRSQLQAAVAALLASHCLPPTKRELVDSKEAAFIRLQD